MTLNHLDLPVSDVGAAQHFFETHFAFRCLHAVPGRLAVLADDADFRLALSVVPANETICFPTGFHLGFVLRQEEDVRRWYERLTTAGVPIRRPLGQLAGALTFHCEGPDGVLVEVTCRP